uniref:Uncharacterized protein n=1 Tax=Anguilla anguilla TaxID=7936 RepID=A0A0E9UEZ3_ANGAN
MRRKGKKWKVSVSKGVHLSQTRELSHAYPGAKN